MNPRSLASGRGNRAYIIYYASQINEDSYIILTGQLYTDQSSLNLCSFLSLDWPFSLQHTTIPEIFLVFSFYECHSNGVLQERIKLYPLLCSISLNKQKKVICCQSNHRTPVIGTLRADFSRFVFSFCREETHWFSL